MPDHDPDQQPSPALDAAGAAAVDRLLEEGGVFGSVSDRDARFGAAESRVLRLLALLEPSGVEKRDAERDRLLIDVTMARVLRSRDTDLAGRIGSEHEGALRLSETSAAALDAAADADWSAADPRLSALLSSLDSAPPVTASSKDRLVQSTLDRIQSTMPRMRFRVSEEELAPRSRMRMTLNDVLAAAAAVGLAGVVIAPMVVNARATTRETVCAMNMGRAGLGFSLFAADHDGAMPSVFANETGGRRAAPMTASYQQGGSVSFDAQPMPITVAIRTDAAGRPLDWWLVGTSPTSHSANLFTLVRAGYASASDLTCPGNESAQKTFDKSATDWATPEGVSYSYQLFANDTPRWSTGHAQVVLADKSPVIDRARRGETPDPTAPSTNHAARGQNVLFNNGAVQFLTRPVLESGDNIWLPQNLERLPSPTLRGVERPQSESDAFVGP